MIFGERSAGGDAECKVADVFEDVGDHQRPVDFCSYGAVHAVLTGVALEVGAAGSVEDPWVQGEGKDTLKGAVYGREAILLN